ncbi:MAG: ATP-binding cassette domain-containing protein, partial [Oscillospiraceae bacterium]|nr:ATP-binding cassette domain-containing protein [Oscillospiraceae bacterium]
RDFPASVWEIVLSGCMNSLGLRPFYGKAQKARAEEALQKLDIADLRRRCYRELSGGQQQRVLLARALCATGKLLLLDEPVSGLDPRVTAELYRIIRDLNREGITILMISHDLQAAAEDASHILHVGRELFFGTKADYLRSSVCRCFQPGRGKEA